MGKVFRDFEILFDKPISKQKMDILWRVFKNWREDVFVITAKNCMNSCRFMPTIADFNELKPAVIDPNHNENERKRLEANGFI
jgi:hypothetical protein